MTSCLFVSQRSLFNEYINERADNKVAFFEDQKSLQVSDLLQINVMQSFLTAKHKLKKILFKKALFFYSWLAALTYQLSFAGWKRGGGQTSKSSNNWFML